MSSGTFITLFQKILKILLHNIQNSLLAFSEIPWLFALATASRLCLLVSQFSPSSASWHANWAWRYAFLFLFQTFHWGVKMKSTSACQIPILFCIFRWKTLSRVVPAWPLLPTPIWWHGCPGARCGPSFFSPCCSPWASILSSPSLKPSFPVFSILLPSSGPTRPQ